MRLYKNKLMLYKDGKLYNIIMKHKEPEGPNSFVITYSVDSGDSKASTINAGDSILNYTPTKDGYTFVGWRTDKTASNDVLSDVAATEATTLYAVFSKTVTVSYNANGGSGTTSSSSGTMYYNNGNTVGATISLRSNGFSRTNYTFQKWASGSASGTQYSVGASVTLTADTKFYAVWKVVSAYYTTTNSSFSLSGEGTIPLTYSSQTSGQSIFSLSSHQITVNADCTLNLNIGFYDEAFTANTEWSHNFTFYVRRVRSGSTSNVVANTYTTAYNKAWRSINQNVSAQAGDKYYLYAVNGSGIMAATISSLTFKVTSS